MGGGGAGSSGAKQAAKSQAAIVRNLFSQTNKGRELGLDQTLNVLRTGGRGAVVPPIIRQSTQAVDFAKDSTIADVVNASNKVGGGSDFTKTLAPTISQQGGVLKEQARSGLVAEILGKAPEVGVSGVQLATQGITGLVRRGAAEETAKSQQKQQIAVSTGSAVGGAIAAGVVAYLI